MNDDACEPSSADLNGRAVQRDTWGGLWQGKIPIFQGKLGSTDDEGRDIDVFLVIESMNPWKVKLFAKDVVLCNGVSVAIVDNGTYKGDFMLLCRPSASSMHVYTFDKQICDAMEGFIVAPRGSKTHPKFVKQLSCSANNYVHATRLVAEMPDEERKSIDSNRKL